jgi:ribose transport system substrate-binding protein
MNSGYHWGTIKMGAETAAREFNVDIDYAASDDEEDIDGQIALVNKVLDNKDKKVDALILAASDYNALVGVTEKAYKRGIPVIIIDSEVNTNKIDSYIASNNLEAGQKAGNILVKLAGTDCNVAIMSFVKGTRNAEEREEGLLNAFSAYPKIKVVAKEYCLSNTKLAYTLAKKMISENPNLDAIVALNSISAEGVAQAVDEMGLRGIIKIIAFDSTSQEIDYLESGVIQATVIQNPFSMGYLGVKYAIDVINKKKVEKRVYTESKVIIKDTMYLPENQKLLFPFIK